MVDNVGAFVGEWQVGQISNPASPFQSGSKMAIGTGKYGDTPPALTPEYKIVVGFAILAPDGRPIVSSQDGGNEPLLFLFAGGTLRYAGFYQQKPLRLYIAMAEAFIPTTGLTQPAIYGTTLTGDPDQVGVWGAEAPPPP